MDRLDPKKYSELTEAHQLQDGCDVQETNIILHGLPPDVYALQVQVNTKFLNALPPEWSKFVTDVKLAKSLYTTNYDQLYAYLNKHERNANEVRIMRERYPDPLALVASTYSSSTPSHSNHSTTTISFSTTIHIFASFHLQTNNSERLPIPEIRQPFKMEESQFNKFKEDKIKVLLALEIEELLQPQGETMQLEKLMLAEAQEADQILDEEKLAFIGNSRSSTVLMAKLSSCDSDVLSEVSYSDTYLNDMINQEGQEMPYSKQTHIVDFPDNEIKTLKNELRKLKGKNIVDTAISKPSATIAPGMFKLDIEPISHSIKNNRDAHEVYLEKTIENTDTFRGLVECARKQNPSKPLLESACMFTKHVKELLVHVSKTCPNLTKSNEKLVAVTPINKDKKVRLSHLNFDYITSLAKHGLIRGLPKLKYQKDHLCFACALGKSKKHSHKPKAEDSIQEKLYLLHIDLCGPMRIQSINRRKYILVIVDDYSWFTWVKFLRSKDETLKAYYEEVGISHQTSVARTPQQNGVVERRNRTLVEAARTMLIFSKALLFLWAEAVATACYTQNRSLIQKCHNKTPSRPRSKLMTPRTIISGLVQNIPSLTSYVPPTKNDWEILFQYMFDEYLNPLPYAPSTSTSQKNKETPSLVIPLGVEEADHDIEVVHMDNNPYIDFPIPESSSEETSTQVVIPNNVHLINQPPEHINKWTKDHPIDNVIGDPSRPVSTRHQLQDEALLCYFDAFLSSVEPKSYKEALTESCWIEAMQEELNEFERLEVWELVPRPDRVMIITLKWIYKVKLDELGGVLKNKARLVARGYRQEEGIDFEESFAPVA
ncbi:putative ribonuclease H-like domain-containing protein [Tanacetum coccineum]